MEPKLPEVAAGVETIWVVVAAIFVLFMQPGFMLLEREPELDAPLVAVSSTRVQRARSADALNPFLDRYLGRVPRK